MAFRWIVNAGLIAIPIGSTLGVLFGIDASRQASGQSPLFSSGGSSGGTGGSGGGSGGSGGGSWSDSTGGFDLGDHYNETELGVTLSRYCNLSLGVTPPAKGVSATLVSMSMGLVEFQLTGSIDNPNQWGVINADGPNATSSMCMNVSHRSSVIAHIDS